MEIEEEIPFPEKLQGILEERIFKRQLILWFFFKKKLTLREISEETGIPYSTVRDCIVKCKSEGNIDDKERSGRPSSVSLKDQSIIIEMQKADRRKPATAIHKELIEQGREVSYHQTLYTINSVFETVYSPYEIQLTIRNKEKE